MGTPWLIDTVHLASDQEILFEDGVVIESKPGSGFYVDGVLFKCASLQNVTLKGYGATLKMRRDLFTSGKPYKPSEFRHAIIIYASRNVKILGLTIKDAGGDGIMIGGLTHSSYNHGVLIKDVLITTAYRTAISVISAENLTIDNAVLINPNGPSPQVGLDFEPGDETQRIVNFAVRHCIIMNNKRLGISFPPSGLLTTSKRERGIPITGVIENFSGDIFGRGAGEQLSKEMSLEFLGHIELRPDYQNTDRPTVLVSEMVKDEYEKILDGVLKQLEIADSK